MDTEKRLSVELISHLDQVTTDWLTAVLENDRALIHGEVEFFDVRAGGGNWSDNAILELRYSDLAVGLCPPRLFLKMVDTGKSSAEEYFGPSEVDYYTRDYVDVPGAPLVRCYHAAYSEKMERYHLLLDDLSETHVEATQKTPTLDYGFALAEGLAAMHARWWGAKGLKEAGAPIHDPEHIRRFVDIAEPGAGHIIEHFSSELKPRWPVAIRELYANHPAAIIERTREANGFTLIHGDPGQANILVPREGDRPIYLLDRQPFDWSLTSWMGVYDLAYAMVLDWDVNLRRDFEIPVLRRYHEWLQKYSVEDYSWERLFDDYRLCVAMGVYIATEYCRGGINQRSLPIWLRYLQRSLTACDDLNCSELWRKDLES